MRPINLSPLTLEIAIERWPLTEPFRITGHTWDFVEVLRTTLGTQGQIGQGEAAGIYYKNDTPTSMAQQVEQLRPIIEAGLSRYSLQQLLPAGGARNALDCALWDLESKTTGLAAWQLARLEKPRPILTTFTCGAEEPAHMAAAAIGYQGARAIKLKLTGEPIDAERVTAVRAARPDVWLSVDANQGFSRYSLEHLMPTLSKARVALIEQPFPIGQEALLEGFQSPIPIAADESAQVTLDIPSLVGRFQAVNIKLDKCGGLTEALAMARAADAAGLKIMVGNMLGTSLGMAPACVVAQFCEVVDLDGPIFLVSDREVTVTYADGEIMCPESLWGGPLRS